MSNLKSIIDEFRDFGVNVVLQHIYSKIKKDPYIYKIAKQTKSKNFDERQIAQVLKKRYKRVKGVELNLENPQTFDEKVNWLMLYDARPIKTKLVDKYEVREYVKSKIGEDSLIPLLGVWDNPEEINFDILPEKFVLKLNNGSGMNLIIKDKRHQDFEKVKSILKSWLNSNYAYEAFEMQYRDVKQRIVAEKYLEDLDSNLYDYKFHCFSGEIISCQVIGSRNLENHSGEQAFYDSEWKKQNITLGLYPEFKEEINKPKNWEEMKKKVEILSKDFNYVRVDLYNLDGHIYFSEFTFTPGRGLHPDIQPPSLDYEWGNLLQLPEKYNLDYDYKEIRE